MEVLKAFLFLCVLLTSFLELRFVSACKSSDQCSGINEICSNRNTCVCGGGYDKNSNGTCVEQTTNGEDNSVYEALVVVFSVLIVIVLISITIYLFLRRRKAMMIRRQRRSTEKRLQMTNLKHKPSIRQILGEYNEPKHLRLEASSFTEEDFERLVQSLKEDAPVFLDMINEVKRKLDMLEDKNTEQGMQYKALIRDLSRILRMLNRKPGKLEMPSDGVPLLLWAENALKRFEYVELQNPITQGADGIGETSTAAVTSDAVL